jgi:hypothetical protein
MLDAGVRISATDRYPQTVFTFWDDLQVQLRESFIILFYLAGKSWNRDDLTRGVFNT